MTEKKIVSSPLQKNYTVVLPSQIRWEMGLKPGDRIDFVPEGNGAVTIRKHAD